MTKKQVMTLLLDLKETSVSTIVRKEKIHMLPDFSPARGRIRRRTRRGLSSSLYSVRLISADVFVCTGDDRMQIDV